MTTRIVNGAAGWAEIADTDSHTGEWEYIEILEDAKFAVLTGNVTSDRINPDAGTAVNFLAGEAFPGRFTTIQLHSGRIRAYRKSN